MPVLPISDLMQKAFDPHQPRDPHTGEWTKVYHISPSRNREGIAAKGLVSNVFDDENLVYGYTDLAHARRLAEDNPGTDLYEARTRTADLIHRPNTLSRHPGERTIVALPPVTPDRLKIVRRGKL